MCPAALGRLHTGVYDATDRAVNALISIVLHFKDVEEKWEDLTKFACTLGVCRLVKILGGMTAFGNSAFCVPA